MQAILKTPSNVVVRSKVIQDSCRCQGWIKHQSMPQCPGLLPHRFISSITKCTGSAGSLHLRHQNIHQGYPCLPQPVILLETNPETNFNGFNVTFVRGLSSSPALLEKEPSSKVEQTVKAIKGKTESKAMTPEQPKVVKKSLKEKIWHEMLHYYHGFRLLFIDINISRKLLWRVLNGKTLSRREHRLLVRTVGDLFRLLPFSVFIIVPFMELLLPLAIKLFPGMLPSTFQTATEKEDKLKQSFKVRLEMAKFLQTTLDDMSVQSKEQTTETAKEFTDFFKKIRSSGETPTNEEIIKFSTLFEDEITLDSLSRQQLTALCRVLDINPMGTTNLLRFQIRMRLRNLAADDKMIMKEGIDSLTIQELQAACQARAMRAYGVSEDKLKSQLAQWLDLSVNEKVPPSLLLLSRALMLPDTVGTTDQLKATISALPDTVELSAKAALSEREGVLDNKTKIELIKAEERKIQEERAEQTEALKQKGHDPEELIDKAPVLRADAPEAAKSSEKKDEEITSTDIQTLEHAIDALGKEKKKMILEKEELNELKEELHDYEEDVKELTEVLATAEPGKPQNIHESKAAKNLFKKVNKMISKMDTVLDDLESQTEKIKARDKPTDKSSEELVKIDELIDVIKRIQKVTDDSKIEHISKVLGKIDDDHDGAISVDEVLKVIELIGKENVQLSSKQVDEILDLIDKEEALELEDQIEKALEKQSIAEKVQPPSTATQKATQSEQKSSGGSQEGGGKEQEGSGKGEVSDGRARDQMTAISMSPESVSKQTISEPNLSSDTTKKL